MTETIEHLIVAIPKGTAEAFLKADAAIWTPALAAQPGFLSKETWIDRTDPTRVHLIIRWTSYDAWKSVPSDLLSATDAAMTDAFGHPVPVLSCGELTRIG